MTFTAPEASGLTPSVPGIPGGPQEPHRGVTVDFWVIGGALIAFLGLGMLVLGAVHAFANGTCSTTGYSRYYGPVPHCAKGIGWWAGMLTLGIFVGLAGLVLIAHRDTFGPASAVAAVLAGAIGVSGAFVIAAGVKSAIGKVPAPSTTLVGGSGVGSLSAAQVRQNKVQICKDLVGAQTLLSARVRTSLISQCQADPAAAQARLAVEVKAAIAAFSIKKCDQGVPANSSLPPAAQKTLETQCAKSVKSGGKASTAATAAALCQQIVKAQVPPAVQPQALAQCPKP
jgi:hypothetical protein